MNQKLFALVVAAIVALTLSVLVLSALLPWTKGLHIEVSVQTKPK